jgi:hypothetical protein
MLVAAIGGLPFTWGIAYSLYLDMKEQKTWVRSLARIVDSRVVERSRHSSITHHPEIRYRYTYNGRDYTSDRVATDDVDYGWRGAAQKVADRYPVGSEVSAFVDPEKPENALLEPGHSWFTIMALFLGGLIWAGVWLTAWVRAVFPRGWLGSSPRSPTLTSRMQRTGVSSMMF